MILNKLKENKATIASKLEQQKRLNDRKEVHYQDQITGLKREIQQLKVLIYTHENKYAVSLNHFKRLKQLLAKKFLSRADYITAQEHHVDIQLRLNESRQQLSAKQNQLSETTNQ